MITIPDSNPNNNEQLPNFVDISPVYNFGNQEIILGVNIEKSNDKSSASKGDTITYSLIVTNTGNQTIFGLDIIDILPGGFSYIPGTTSGITTSDQLVTASKLTWENVTNLAGGDSINLTYQVLIGSDLSDGTFVNVATCKGSVRTQEGQVECNEDDSTVTLGSGRSFGGNLVGQVLGASTELPATGSPTVLLLIALGLLGTGFILKKYAKN